MTIRKYMPPVHVHPILMVFIVISFVTGTFVELSIILAIVLFHELGHFIMAKLFNWRIRGIMLWVFGGVMDTDEHGNKPLYEEALVIIAGPIQHLVIYLLLFVLSSFELFSPYTLDLMIYYNTVLLIFNLLPIWPLDGGKLLFAILSMVLPYKKAYSTIIIFSIIASLSLLMMQFFLFPFTLSAFLLMLFLLMENRSEWKQRYYVFIRFLLKRYEGESSVKSVRPIVVPHQASLMDVFAHFRREKKHPIYITYPKNARKSIDENDCLRSYFYDKQYHQTIDDVVKYVT